MGPLEGVTVIELGGIGPGPFCAMMLADLGADVIRIDRIRGPVNSSEADAPRDLLNRGRLSISVNLKSREGVEMLLRMVESCDILVEGFRPGVVERLGLGPAECLARNPALVYGRMTGWGQEGPLADSAGHDINYIALSGVLSLIGRADTAPLPPLNLVGDFGGGGMLLAFGLLAGLTHARSCGQGQVVDAAMVDGAALLATMMVSMKSAGSWSDARGTNLLDTGAHFYDVYECSDNEYVSIGSIEPQFYSQLLDALELDPSQLPRQFDRSQWPALKERFSEIFLTRTRSEWCERMEGTDICFAPVLSLDEAMRHPHNAHRATYVEADGVMQPAPAPRFSSTPAAIPKRPPAAGENTSEVLDRFGFGAAEVEALKTAGAVA